MEPVVSDSIKSYFKFLLRLDFGRVEPGQGAWAFWPGEVQGLCGVLAVRVTRPGRGGWWLTPVLMNSIFSFAPGCLADWSVEPS